MVLRRLSAVLCCLALLGSSSPAAWPDQGQAAFAAALEASASRRPDDAFDRSVAAPEGFEEFLAAHISADQPLTNEEMLSLYRRYLTNRSQTGAPGRSLRLSRVPLDKLSLALLPEGGGDFSPVYDKAKKSGSAPADAAAKPGVLGLEVTGGRNFLLDNNEPFPRLGLLQQAVPLKVSPWVDMDGLGARVTYLRPEPFKSLSVGFLSLLDVPAALGLDRARDWAMARFGATALKPRGGFQAATSGAINEYLGGQTSYVSERSLQGRQGVDQRRLTVGAGVSPWLDPDHRQKWTVTSSLVNEAYSLKQPGYEKERHGFGYAAGLVYQRALSQSPLEGLVSPAAGAGALQFDRLKTGVEAGSSPSTDFTLTATAEVATRLFKRLELDAGIKDTWFARPDRKNPYVRAFNPAAIVGLRLRY